MAEIVGSMLAGAARAWIAEDPEHRIAFIAKEVVVYAEIVQLTPEPQEGTIGVLGHAIDQWYGHVYQPGKPRFSTNVGDQPSGDAAVSGGGASGQPTRALGPGAAWPRRVEDGPRADDPKHGEVGITTGGPTFAQVQANGDHTCERFPTWSCKKCLQEFNTTVTEPTPA